MLEAGDKKLRNTLGFSWFNKVGQLLRTDEMKSVAKRVNARRKTPGINVYPTREDTFKAFRLCSFEDTKVVILGQDPYHTVDSADGLAFSTKDPFAKPDTTSNILTESIADWYGGDDSILFDYDLTRWAMQGVLLINSILTVEEGKALSHEKLGWQYFTQRVLAELMMDDEPKVFMVWGLAAQTTLFEACKLMGGEEDQPTPHLVLKAAHPSAETHRADAGGGFFGCEHFSKANAFLKENQFTEIKW